MHRVEFYLFQDLQRALELLCRLARKLHDHVGRDGDVRDSCLIYFTKRKYSCTRYGRAIRRNMSSSPAWTGRLISSHICGTVPRRRLSPA